MTRIYILRKHPVITGYHGGVLQAFTIVGSFANRAHCKNAADAKNKRTQRNRYTVGVVTLKEPSHENNH